MKRNEFSETERVYLLNENNLKNLHDRINEQQELILNLVTQINKYHELEEVKLVLKENKIQHDSPIDLLKLLNEDFNKYYVDNTTKLKESERQLIELETKLKTHRELVDTLSKDKDQIDLLNSKLSELTDLQTLLGKDEFKNFALENVEKRLISMANTEIKNLCDGRYQLIEEKKKNQGQEFYVIDYFSGTGLRKVSTLSGGETFLISLGLSLALAEMTRGTTQIDSFFIDEGFGHLDQESLNDAVNILMAIQTRGKQIGVISHIKELTDRIESKIHLEKNSLGESTLSFYY